jgi:hypothetical protein
MTAAAGISRSDAAGFVYFVRSGASDFIKIGWAAEPHRRLIDLQCGNPEELSLVAIIEGHDDLERHRHASASDQYSPKRPRTDFSSLALS